MSKPVAEFHTFAELADWNKRQQYKKQIAARRPHKGPPPPKPPTARAKPLARI